jgi:hypothetical protein
MIVKRLLLNSNKRSDIRDKGMERRESLNGKVGELEGRDKDQI